MKALFDLNNLEQYPSNYLPFECKFCSKSFYVKKRFVRRTLKIGANYHCYCSKDCQSQAKKTGKNVICDQCGKTFYKVKAEIKKSNHNFCNNSCSAKYSNKHRKPYKVKDKEISCTDCGKTIIVSGHASYKRCDSCTVNHNKKKNPRNYGNRERELLNTIIDKNCIRCNKEFKAKGSSTKKYCDKCRLDVMVEAGKINGKKSAAKQVRRSKNEIYFAELCEREYGNILTNEPFFESKTGKWDADIILPDFKLAILWNGIWHYKKVLYSTKIKQIQSRDRIKEAVIIKNGYEPYIITDMGKYNKGFVEEQFEFLKFYLEYRMAI